jgi:hypothetical protein
MKWSKYTVILLTLNLALLAGIGYVIFQLRRPVAPEPADAQMASPETAAPKAAVRAGPPAAASGTNQFRWSQLESEDYRTYIARLRSIGCPEQTIRDLIIADIDKLLAPRAQAIVPYRPDLKYWQPEEQELWNNYDTREWERQQRSLDYEKRDVVRELLGVDLVGERLRQQGREDYYSRRLGFLPETKRAQVRTILDKYGDQELALREKEWEERESLSPEDRAQLRRIRQERQGELAGVLTPGELQQYDLWLGYTASKVREATYGMEATEDEFLKVYSLRKPFDDQWNPEEVDLADPATRARWQQASVELESKIQQTLGEPRYALYQRGQDPDFRALNALAARYQLGSNAVPEAYAYKKMAQEARQVVASNPSLTPEQQEQALKEIASETERVVKETLGDRAYNSLLRRGNGRWIKAER